MLPTGTVLQESTVPLFWNDGAISAGFFIRPINADECILQHLLRVINSSLNNDANEGIMHDESMYINKEVLMYEYDKEENIDLKNKLIQEARELTYILLKNGFEDTITKKYRDISIDDIGLSPRAYNCLKRAGIDNVYDLSLLKETDLMKVRNMGTRSLLEVMDKLEEKFGIVIGKDYSN